MFSLLQPWLYKKHFTAINSNTSDGPVQVFRIHVQM